MHVSSPCEGIYQTHTRLTSLLSKWVFAGPRSRGGDRAPARTKFEVLNRLDVPLRLSDRPRTADRRSRIPPRIRVALDVARVERLTWYRCARRETRYLRIKRICIADARTRSRESPRARMLRRRVASRCNAQLAKRNHVSLLFEIPQPLDAQRDFVLL